MFVRERLNVTYWNDKDGELDNNDVISHEGNFWSYNDNANWMLTLDADYPQGEVCMGYIEKSRLDAANPASPFLINETISICTNGLKYNAGSPEGNIDCVGKMLNQASTSFNLTVQFDFIEITEVENRHF